MFTNEGERDNFPRLTLSKSQILKSQFWPIFLTFLDHIKGIADLSKVMANIRFVFIFSWNVLPEATSTPNLVALLVIVDLNYEF